LINAGAGDSGSYYLFLESILVWLNLGTLSFLYVPNAIVEPDNLSSLLINPALFFKKPFYCTDRF